MTPVYETPGSLPSPASFINHLHVERDLELWWDKPDNSEKDHWFWDRVKAGESKEYPFTVRNIYRASIDCAVRVSVHGRTDVFISPDHHTRIYLNGNLLKEEEWNGMEPKQWDISNIPCSYLSEGDNSYPHG